MIRVIQGVYTLPFILRNPVLTSKKSENVNGFSRMIKLKIVGIFSVSRHKYTVKELPVALFGTDQNKFGI